MHSQQNSGNIKQRAIIEQEKKNLRMLNMGEVESSLAVL